MANEWFDIDPPEDDIDLSEFQEELYFEFLEQGYSEDEAERLAAKEVEDQETEILRSRQCCPGGVCRGWCS